MNKLHFNILYLIFEKFDFSSKLRFKLTSNYMQIIFDKLFDLDEYY
jgi:hypothetical protein